MIGLPLGAAQAATTYYYYGTTSSTSAYTWTNSTNTVWGNASGVLSGANVYPTTGDTISLAAGHMGAPSDNRSVIVNGNEQILNLDTTGMANPFTFLGSSVNGSLDIVGTVTKNTSSTLTFRNNSTSKLSVSIGTAQVSNGIFTFGSSANNRINSLSITNLNIEGTTTMYVEGTDGSINKIANVDMGGGTALNKLAIFAYGGTLATDTGTVEVNTLKGTNVNSAIGAQSSTVAVGTGILKLNSTASTVSSYAGKLVDSTGAGTGVALKVVKTGLGTQVLSGGLNVYSGGTSIDQGRLLISNGSGSATGTGAVNVTDTGILGGTGRSTGVLTVSSGATIAPGMENSGATGILTVGALDLQLGSHLAIDLNSTLGTGYDQLIVNGTVQLGGNLDISLNFTPTGPTDFTILSNDGTADAILGTFNGWAEGSSKLVSGQMFSITYAGGDGNDIVLSVVPEPSTWMLLGGGLLLLAASRRRSSARA